MYDQLRGCMAKKKEDSASNDRKENIVALTFFSIVVLLIIGFSTNWFGLASQSGSPIVSTPVDDEPFKGDPNAPITIVEFSDFECPFCGRFYRQTLPSLIQQYVDSGRVKIVYKQFPLTQAHRFAMPAAIASECAFRQDKFWEMHDKIFDNQNSLSDDVFTQFAEDIGLDLEKFNSCVESGSARSEVESDFSEGTRASISSTPSFIVGKQEGSVVSGQLVVGAQPVSRFAQIIEG